MRADSRATLPCQPRFSSPPLIGCCPCQQPGSHPAEGERGGGHIYISLTLPRLRLQSIISSCWTFQMNCVKRVASTGKGEGGREEEVEGAGEGGGGGVGWIGPIRNHSQSGWWPLWPESDTRGPALNFKSPCIERRRCQRVSFSLPASTGRPRQRRILLQIAQDAFKLFISFDFSWHDCTVRQSVWR